MREKTNKGSLKPYADGFASIGGLAKGIYVFGCDCALHLDVHALEYGLLAVHGTHGYPFALVFADAYAELVGGGEVTCHFLVASFLYLEAEGHGALHEVYLASVFVGVLESRPIDIEGLLGVEFAVGEVDVVAYYVVVGATLEVKEPALGVGGMKLRDEGDD